MPPALRKKLWRYRLVCGLGTCAGACKPILMICEKAERPEAVMAATVWLVAPMSKRILHEPNLLLDHREVYDRIARIHNPYGDGAASPRISGLIHSFLTGKS